MEWKASWLHDPPKDGTWIIAMACDYSGAQILSFRHGRWYDAGGESDWHETDEDFAMNTSCWALLPEWMLPFLDAQIIKQAREERLEAWRAKRENRNA